MAGKIYGLIFAGFVLSLLGLQFVSAEKIVLFAIDDFQIWWLGNV